MSERERPDEEVAFYEEHFEEFKTKYVGRYLLIYKQELIGDFDSFDDAVEEGIRRYKSGPFLVRQAGEKTTKTSVPLITLDVPAVAHA